MIAKSLSRGGAAAGALYLLEALEATGLEIVGLDAFKAQAHEWRGIARIAERIVERAIDTPESHCIRLAPPVFDLRKLVALHRPDVVQLCDVSGNAIGFSDLASLPCPIVHRMSDLWPYHGPHHYATRRDDGPRSARWLLRHTVMRGASLPDVRVAPSQWLADLLADTGAGSPIRVIRNSVPVPGSSKPRTPPANSVRFGFISIDLLHPRKGLRSLPRAIAGLSATGVKVSLHLHGQIERNAVPVIPGVDVVAHGRFDRRDIDQVFRGFDILLCPSLLDNSPNVVSEALAHGCPVIAQSGTGMDSYVDDTTGALIDFHAETDMATSSFIRAVDRILADYPEYSSRACAYARTHLSPETIGKAYRHLYEHLLTARCRRR